MEACRARAQIWYDEKEAARTDYEKKTPEERALIEQAQLWDNYEFIFVARIDKIKVDGQISPQSPTKKTTPKSAKTKNPKGPVPPPIPVSPAAFRSFGKSYEAFIRPVRWIKGAPAFSAAWRSVGGMNSCGTMPDGALAYSDPDDEFIVFANWATKVSYKNGLKIEDKYLQLYGLEPAELIDPRIKAALAEPFEFAEEK